MSRRVLILSALLAGAAANAAQAQTPIIITQWRFNNYASGTIINTPAPSFGLGAALPLGMTNSYQQNSRSAGFVNSTSVATCDITTTVQATGSNSQDSLNNPSSALCWRVRGGTGTVGGQNGNAFKNGWSIFAPNKTQGVEFRANVSNYTNVRFSFEWAGTTQCIRSGQLQYSTDGGVTFIDIDPTALPTVVSPATATLPTAVTPLRLTQGRIWASPITLDLTGVAGVDRCPDLRIRLVSRQETLTIGGVPTATYLSYNGTEYNNTSGNWQFDDVRFEGVPVGPVAPVVTAAVDTTAVCNNASSQVTFTSQVVPGAAPASQNITVRADLSSLGLSATQSLFDDGSNGDALAGDGVYTFRATVPAGRPLGQASVTVTVSDNQPINGTPTVRTGTTTTSLSVADCTQNAASRVVISQVYGASARSTATDTGAVISPYGADYVELYNRSNQTVDLTGWSVQYANATSTTGFSDPTNKINLSGSIKPGQYLLVRYSDPVAGFGDLPTPDFTFPTGQGGIDNSDGRIALVRSTNLLGTNCADSGVEDLLGFGRAVCFEGAGSAPATSTLNALFRRAGGAQDVNQSFADFQLASPAPRNRASGGFLAGYASASAQAVCSGSSVTFTVTTPPGFNGSNTTVIADVSQIAGQPSTIPLAYDNNTLTFTATYTVPTSPQGVRTVTFISSSAGQTDTTQLPLAVGTCAGNAASRVVISQVFSGGGSGATGFQNDFVEIFNRSSQPVDLTGWSLQYGDVVAVNTGITSRIVPLSGVMQPYTYRLIVPNGAAGSGAALPTADFRPVSNFGMDNQFGLIALVRDTTFVGTQFSGGSIEDYVGYGSTALQFEGVAPVPSLSNITMAVRKQGGFQDTDQNVLDFDVIQTTGLGIVVRNSESPANPPANTSIVCCRGATCGTVTSAASCSAGPGVGVRVLSSSVTSCAGQSTLLAGCCYADFDKSGTRSIDDIFIYLNAWFAGSPFTKVGGDGVQARSIDDIFLFLNAWFAGCN